MNEIMVVGAGKIGSLIACLFAESKQYKVYLIDIDFSGRDHERLRKIANIEFVKTDACDVNQMSQFLKGKKVSTFISCLPYFCNIKAVEIAKQFELNYFDLTEDVAVTEHVAKIAKGAKQAFVPQCGLAPGFISIVANDIMKRFHELDTVKLRVGALPKNNDNALHYCLTWSTDGLINEYGNTCYGVKNGEKTQLSPLEGLEAIQIDGLFYEAFNTSGGLGSLADSYDSKVKDLTYKTIRYPGHCDKMRLLMNDLKLNHDRKTFKRILENALPKTYQDVVLVYVSVTGKQNAEFIEESYVNKVYPQEIAGATWSAIQVTTASGLCAVVDLVLQEPNRYQGLILQEHFTLAEFLKNRFGVYYRQSKSAYEEHERLTY